MAKLRVVKAVKSYTGSALLRKSGGERAKAAYLIRQHRKKYRDITRLAVKTRLDDDKTN